MKPTRRSWIAYPDRYVITPSVGSKWPFLWWRWSKNWTLFTPALACQTTITLKICFPGRNSIIYFCSTFPISFLTTESFWLHLCQGLRALTVPILRGHLRPLNSHSLMLICVIIQFVLLFDKVLAFCQYFSNVQMRHRQINIIIVVKTFGVEVSCHKLGEDVIAYFEAYLPSGNKCGQQKPITGENSWKDF